MQRNYPVQNLLYIKNSKPGLVGPFLVFDWILVICGYTHRIAKDSLMEE